MIAVNDRFVGQLYMCGNNDGKFFLHACAGLAGLSFFLLQSQFDACLCKAALITADHLLYAVDDFFLLFILIADVIEIGVPYAATELIVGGKAIKGRSENQVQVMCNGLLQRTPGKCFA